MCLKKTIKLIPKRELENECRVISGIKYNIYCDFHLHSKMKDIVQHHFHEETFFLDCFYDIYIIEDEKIYGNIVEKISSDEYLILEVFKDRNYVSHVIRKYNIYDMDVFYNLEDRCIHVTRNNIIYIITSSKTSEKNRQLLRIIREINLREYEDRNCCVLHGGACILNDKGIIIIGNKGAGKTTLISHLLNSDSGKFVANDLVYIEEQNSKFRAITMPVSIKVGTGTVSKFKEYSKYINSNKLSEKQKREHVGYDKYLITPKELSKVFNIPLIDAANIELIIQCEIRMNDTEVFISQLSLSEKKAILKENFRTPTKKWKDPWVIPRINKRKDLEKNSFKMQNNMSDNIKIIKLNYGAKSSTEDIISCIKSYLDTLISCEL